MLQAYGGNPPAPARYHWVLLSSDRGGVGRGTGGSLSEPLPAEVCRVELGSLSCCLGLRTPEFPVMTEGYTL